MEDHMLLSRKEAAAMLSMSTDTLDRLIRNEALVAVRIGGAVKIRRREVVALIERSTVSGRRAVGA